MQHTDTLPAASDPFTLLLVDSLEGLMRQALGLTRSRAAAEDLVQETAARALRFRAQFTMGTNFRAWVSTILTHTFIHTYRHDRREREATVGEGQSLLSERLGLSEPQAHLRAPDANVTTFAFGDEVRGALSSLTAEFREVVTLCDIDGMSYRAIAAQLACPIGTVMSRLHRARRVLGRELGDFARGQGIVRDGEVAAA